MRGRVRLDQSGGPAKTLDVAGDPIRLGRGAECEVAVDPIVFPKVSALHDWIESTAQGFVLVHLSRNNKTLLNAAPVEGMSPVRVGDRIRLGFTGPAIEMRSATGPRPPCLVARSARAFRPTGRSPSRRLVLRRRTQGRHSRRRSDNACPAAVRVTPAGRWNEKRSALMDHNPLDVSAKDLILDGPAAWAERFGIGPPGPVSVIDSEITTLTASADKVLRVNADNPYLLNLEPHAYHHKELARTLWYRQVALDYKHNLPVLTVLILLRKEANSPRLTGSYERHLPDGSLTNRYNYRVVRLWQEDPDVYLTGGVNLVPLAPLTKVTKAGLPGLVRRMDQRINAEPRPRADKLWAATYVLMGWRYDEKQATEWLKGVWNMHESPTYQAILKRGRDEGLQEGLQEEARRLLLRQGTRRFGTPDAGIIAAVEAIHDVDRLESLTDRIFDATAGDWNDLLRGS